MRSAGEPVGQSLPIILSGTTTTTAAAAAPATEYANYIDVKLEGIHHLPADWISAGAPPLPPPTTVASAAGAGGGGNAAVLSASLNHLPVRADEDGAGAEVAYAYHPFRYEVSLALPAEMAVGPVAAAEGELSEPMAVSLQSPSIHDAAPHPSGPANGAMAAAAAAGGGSAAPAAFSSATVVAAFTNGRMLRCMPAYAAYISAAEAPPVAGVDDAAVLRDVPAAIEAEDIHHGGSTTTNTTRATTAVTAAAAGGGGGEKAGRDDGPAPSILWVVTERTEGLATAAAAAGGGGGGNNNSSITGGAGQSTGAAGLVAAKRRMKSSAASQPAAPAAAAAAAATAAAAAAVPFAPPPPLPDVSEAPPCVVRVPLTAAQEAYVAALLQSGAPLELRFRRVLRLGCPAEWEDLNASYYEAVIPVSLQGLAEPGSTQLAAEVPLQPASLYIPAGRASSLMSGAGLVGESGVFGNPTNANANNNNNNHATNSGSVGGDHGERNKKRAVNRKARQTVPGLLVDEPDRSAPHPYALAGTTARVSIRFQRTLTRLLSDRIRPAVTPAQLIPSRPVPSTAAAAAADVKSRLQSALQGIAAHLLTDVRAAVRMSAPAAAGHEGSDDGDARHGSGVAADSAAWRARFVTVLQSTGQLAAFKSLLTPLVTELVQERLRLHPATSADDVARASNELYVQLMDMLHATLSSASSAAAAHGSPNHADAVAPAAGVRDDELRWRAMEAEITGDLAIAATLYQSRLATHSGEGGAEGWAALWMECALHYQRTEQLAKAEQCYREAISCDARCVPALLDYGVWLLAHDRLDEAAVFLHGLVDVAPLHQLGWGCVGLLADLRELAVRSGSVNAEAALAQWRGEHSLSMRRAVECAQAEQASATGDDHGDAAAPLTAEERVYVMVATYLLQQHHRDLANVCLARCRPGHPQVELLYAQLFAQGGQYGEALAALEEATKAGAAATATSGEAALAEAADACVLLKAECAAAQGRTADAILLLKEALAKDSAVPAYLPQLAAQWRADAAAHRSTTNAATSAALLAARTVDAAGRRRLAAYVQLCNLLLADGRYKDALGAATLALQVWPDCAVLWLAAGIAYFRAGDFIAAEGCLQESNTLNTSNARTWVYLTLLAVRLQHSAVEEMVQQALTLNLDDAALWAELGRTLLATAQYPRLSIVCLRRAAAIARAQVRAEAAAGESPERRAAAPAAASLLYPTLYHLAHALMDGQQWDEAERLLSEVAAEGAGNEVLRGKAEEELALLRTA